MFKKFIRIGVVSLTILGWLAGSVVFSQTKSFNLNVTDANVWYDTGIDVNNGCEILAKIKNIIRWEDVISINSNGEWIWCWNSQQMKNGKTLALGIKDNPARPLPDAFGGAIIFKIGINGKPFFIPRIDGNPGKDYTPQLGVDNYSKLPGYNTTLTHKFKAENNGRLYVGINIATNQRTRWIFIDYNVNITVTAPTEGQITGKIIDETGKAISDVDVTLVNVATTKSAIDGSFNFVVKTDGIYTLLVKKPGFFDVQKQVTIKLAESAIVNLGNIILIIKPGKIVGIIVGEDGKPQSAATVIAGGTKTISGIDGKYELTLKPGIYTIEANKIMTSGIATGKKDNVQVLPDAITDAGNIVIVSQISPKNPWTQTNTKIISGQTITIKASGKIRVVQNGVEIGPDGLANVKPPATQVILLPEAPWGAFIAKVSETGKIVLIGKEKTFIAENTGTLFFGVNDNIHNDNSGSFKIDELKIESLGGITGTIVSNDNKLLTMAIIKISDIKDTFTTDEKGNFTVKNLIANKNYTIIVSFPGYRTETKTVNVGLGLPTDIGTIKMAPVPVTGTVQIKLLPKTGVTGGLIPVFVEVVNTSSNDGLWGGYLISIKAVSVQTNKEYRGMSPTYLILALGERKGTELLWHIPVDANTGDYKVYAELSIPEMTSIQDATKQFRAKQDLLEKLQTLKSIKGQIVSTDVKPVKIVKGIEEVKFDEKAKLLLPTITPKIFSPQQGQVVTDKIALREKAIVVMGKEVQIFKDKDGGPMPIWNNYEGLYLSARKEGARKDDWIWIGQSDVQSDDFTVHWDTKKMKDGDYLVKATMRTTYNGKPLEGSMSVMVKVRNDTRQGKIEGRVIDEDGLPVEGADVQRLSRTQSVSGIDWNTMGTESNIDWSAEDVTKTGADGKFVFSNILNGDYKINCSKENYSSVESQVGLFAGESFNLGDQKIISTPGKISGKIILENKSNPKGSIVTIAKTGLTVTVVEDGVFVFDKIKKGKYTIEIKKDKFKTKTVDVQVLPGETTNTGEVVLLAEGGLVKGIAKDDKGQILSGVKIILDTGQTTISDKDGKFSFTDVPIGGHKISFEIDGFKKLETEIVVTGPDNPSEVGEVTLIKIIGNIKGKVTDLKTDKPIANVPVKITTGASAEVQSVTTDEGDFLLKDLVPGVYSVVAEKEGYSKVNQAIEVKPFETSNINFKLEQIFGAINGQIVDEKGGGINDVKIIVLNPPMSTISHFVSFGPPGALAGTNGIFEIETIPTGKRMIEFSHPVYTKITKTVEIENKKTLDLGIIKLVKNIPNLGQIKGKVTDDKNISINRAVVILKDLEPQQLATTNAQGEFVFADIPVGLRRLAISFPGFESTELDIEVKPGETAQPKVGGLPPEVGGLPPKVILKKIVEEVTGVIRILNKPAELKTNTPERIFTEIENKMQKSDSKSVPYYVEVTAENKTTKEKYKHLAPTVVAVEKGQIRQAQLIVVLPKDAKEGNYDITVSLMSGDIDVQDVTKSKGKILSEIKDTIKVTKGVSQEELAKIIQLLPPTIVPEIISPQKGRIVTGEIKLQEFAIVGWGQNVEIVNSAGREPWMIADNTGRGWEISNVTNIYWHRRYDPMTGQKGDWIWIGESSLFGNNFEVGWDTSLLKDGDYEIRAKMAALVGEVDANGNVAEKKHISGELVIPVTVRNKSEQGSIKGQITDDAGKPIERATVKRSKTAEIITGITWEGRTVSRSEWVIDEIKFTDASGMFEFTNLLKGSYKFAFEKIGYNLSDNREVNVESGKVVDTGKMIIIPKNGSIIGNVIDENGTPLAGVEISGTIPQKVITDSFGQGSYELKDIKPGEYILNYKKDNYVVWVKYNPYKNLMFTQEVKPDSQKIEVKPEEQTIAPQWRLESKPGIIKGKVIDTKGNSVANVQTRLNPGDKDFLITDLNGIFESGPSKKGEYSLSFTKDGYNDKTVPVTVKIAETTDIGNVTIEPILCKIVGSVTPENTEIELARVGKTTGGNFSFENLVAGNYVLKFIANGYESEDVAVTLKPGDTASVTRQMKPKPGKIAGKTVDNKNNVLGEVKISIGGEQKAVTNANGEFITPDIVIGKYVLEFDKAGYEHKAVDIEIKAGMEQNIGTVSLNIIPGTLSGKIIPENANIFVNEKSVPVKNGNFETKLEPGEYKLKITAKGYKPFEQTITINPGNHINLDINLKEKSGKITGKIEPADTTLKINGEKINVTNGVFSKDLPSGKHTIIAEGPDFDTIQQEVQINRDEETKIDLKLKKKTGKITGNVIPANAVISIDDRRIKTTKPDVRMEETQSSVRFVVEIVIGTHKVNVSATGYKPFEKNVDVKAKEETFIEIMLERQSSRFSTKIKPVDADVFIDGVKQEILKDGTMTKDIFPGKFMLTVKHNDFEGFVQEITIEPEKPLDLNVDLKPKPGKIVGNIIPPDAKVSIDGIDVEVKPDGSFEKEIGIGRYRVRVEKNKFKSQERIIEVKPNKSERVDINLETKEGKLEGKVTPADSTVLVSANNNPVEIKGNKFGINLPAGKHKIKATREGFKTFDGEVEIKPDEITQIEIQLHQLKSPVAIKIEPVDVVVWVDDNAVEIKDGKIQTELLTGKHTIRITRDGFDTVEREIDVQIGIPVDLSIKLDVAKGTLIGSIVPSEAKISINNEIVELDRGNFRKTLPAGDYTVSATLEGYSSKEEKVKIEAGKITTLSLRLDKKVQIEAKISAEPSDVIIGEEVKITVEDNVGNTEVELRAEKGIFKETQTETISGKTDNNRQFIKIWSCWTPGKYKITARAKKGEAISEKLIEVNVSFVPPDIDASVGKPFGEIKVGQPIDIETLIKNIGKVSGKYRIELEIKGKADVPLFQLQPQEIDLKAGESKKIKFNWQVAAVGEFDVRLRISLIGEKGEVKPVKTIIAKLDLTAIMEMTGKIEIKENKVYFTPEITGMEIKYEISGPGAKQAEKFNGKIVKGKCKVLEQMGNKGLIEFKEPPKEVK